MFKYILARLAEPSTFAGLAGLAISAGLSAPQFQAISAAIAGIAGVIAVFLAEKKM